MAEIGINLRADPAAFISGTKAAEKAMDELEEAAVTGADDIAEKLEAVIRKVVELGTASGKSSDEIAADLRKFGLSAEDAEDAVRAVWDEMGEGQRAARDVQEAADSLKDVSRNADDAADSTKRIDDEIGTTGDKFRDLGSIASDVLEGDFGGAAESAIGSLAALGAFAGAGGALAGFLAAGAGEIIGDWLGQWDRAAEETRKRISSMYQDMLESGRQFLSDTFIADRIAEIYDPENVEEFNRATEFSNQLGVERSTIIQAMAGDTDALRAVQEGAAATLESLTAQQEAHVQKYGEESAAIESARGEAELGIEAWERYAGAQDTAAGRAREAAEAIAQAGNDAGTAAEKARGLTDAMNAIPPGKNIVFTADTAAVYTEIERLRRQAISVSVNFDYVINERRGITLP